MEILLKDYRLERIIEKERMVALRVVVYELVGVLSSTLFFSPRSSENL